MNSSAHSPVPELNLLKEFEERMDWEPFSDGFELFEYGNVSPLGPTPPAEMRDRPFLSPRPTTPDPSTHCGSATTGRTSPHCR